MAVATGERFLNSNLLKIVVKIVYFSIANAITIHYNRMEQKSEEVAAFLENLTGMASFGCFAR